MEEIDSATIGGGCFWCLEAVFSRMDGVISVIPGYSGGNVENPSYEQVCNGETSHAEVVKINYDLNKTSFETLLEWFWRCHDPTTLNRQGGDIGTQYRSVIYYENENQRLIAQKSKKEADSSGIFDNPIVTEIQTLKVFYQAEDYHYDYYKKNPDAGYCNYIIRPKLEKLKLE